LVWFSSRYLALAAQDLAGSLFDTHVWIALGWQEVQQRYRRSKLGPFWLTISTGAMVAGMGPLYGRLLNVDLTTYFAYLATSLVVWQLIAGVVLDSCQAFISAESVIKQIKLPLSMQVLRVVWRNLIIFAHNFIIIIVVLVLYPPNFGWHMLLMPLGLCVLCINAVWIGLALGMVCARFRDIPQIVQSLLQLLFFLTPVMWRADTLGRNVWAANINPLYHFVEIVRTPLLIGPASVMSWACVGFITIVGWLLTFAVFARFRGRIAYWV